MPLFSTEIFIGDRPSCKRIVIFQATVLEVKAIPGLGTTIDVILINGSLRIGDALVLAGTEGPITTQIRSLLTPDGMKELRVKVRKLLNSNLIGWILLFYYIFYR